MKTYAHTPQGTAISGNPTKIDSLTHADAAHPDRLTKLGYKNITYNSMGYPITYGSKYLDWENGKLKKYYDEEDPYGSLSSESVEFGYNAYGQLVRENNQALDKTLLYEYIYISQQKTPHLDN